MRIAKGVLVGLISLPFVIALLVGAALVAVALFAIYLLAAVAYPAEVEWSA